MEARCHAGPAAGKAAAADVGVTAVDDWTLQAVMEDFTPFFPMVVSLWPFFPLPRSVIESVGDDKWMEPENIQTAGPFIFETWDHDQQMVFRRNQTLTRLVGTGQLLDVVRPTG